MSPAAAREAEKLGYTNVKVYHEGLPEWTKRNPMALTPKFLKEAWFDKTMPIVVLDARPAEVAKTGFIPGAAAFPKADAAAIGSLPDKKLKAPILVYDEDGKGNAKEIAKALVAAGYNRTLVLVGGFGAWKAAGYGPATGEMAAKIVYVPKLKPGEVAVDEFRKLVGAIPADTILLDVRNAADTEKGMFKGAVNIPLDDIENRLAELPKEKRIVAYCNTGVQAEMGYNMLKAKGYTRLGFVKATVASADGVATIKE